MHPAFAIAHRICSRLLAYAHHSHYSTLYLFTVAGLCNPHLLLHTVFVHGCWPMPATFTIAHRIRSRLLAYANHIHYSTPYSFTVAGLDSYALWVSACSIGLTCGLGACAHPVQ